MTYIVTGAKKHSFQMLLVCLLVKTRFNSFTIIIKFFYTGEIL